MTDDSTEQPYGVAAKAQPIIKPERWYIANDKAKVVIVDQPGVGFATEGAASMYVRALGPHIDQRALTVVPGTQVLA